MPFVVPPGGIAGFNQMTPASKAALGGGNAGYARTRKQIRKSKKRVMKARRKDARARKAGKMKFGSPAWRKKYNLGKKKR